MVELTSDADPIRGFGQGLANKIARKVSETDRQTQLGSGQGAVAIAWTQPQHVVESTRVLNNHETYFVLFCKDRYTDTQTGAPVEVPP